MADEFCKFTKSYRSYPSHNTLHTTANTIQHLPNQQLPMLGVRVRWHYSFFVDPQFASETNSTKEMLFTKWLYSRETFIFEKNENKVVEHSF